MSLEDKKQKRDIQRHNDMVLSEICRKIEASYLRYESRRKREIVLANRDKADGELALIAHTPVAEIQFLKRELDVD